MPRARCWPTERGQMMSAEDIARFNSSRKAATRVRAALLPAACLGCAARVTPHVARAGRVGARAERRKKIGHRVPRENCAGERQRTHNLGAAAAWLGCDWEEDAISQCTQLYVHIKRNIYVNIPMPPQLARCLLARVASATLPPPISNWGVR
jgi:hypothetical protein